VYIVFLQVFVQNSSPQSPLLITLQYVSHVLFQLYGAVIQSVGFLRYDLVLLLGIFILAWILVNASFSVATILASLTIKEIIITII